MAGVRQYFLSVISAAILCGIISNLAGKKGSVMAVLKMITGLILAFTVIRPIAAIDIQELTLFTSDIQTEAEAAAAIGECLTSDSMAAIIKRDTEAYILDKATALQATLTVNVTLEGDPPLPESVILSGSVSPYTKAQLQAILETDLDIPKEKQLWIQ